MSEHEHSEDDGADEIESLEMGLDLRTQIFLAMREQNLELLKIAAQVAGYGKEHAPLKPDDVRKALKSVWDVYSEFYTWVDPEETEEGEEDE